MTRQSAGIAVGLAGVVAAVLAPAALAQDDAEAHAGLPVASPGAVGMSADALDRIAPAMQAYVGDGRLAAVMTMVARRGQVVHWDAVGTRDTATGDPLERDDIFRIYSMTKPVTSVAVMILVEEGRVALDDPVSKFVPEFAGVKVLADGGDRVPAEGPITVEHLLTHTSGLTYGLFGDSAVDRLYNQANPLRLAEGLDDFARRVAELPLLASPGTRWNYSVSTDVLGRVVEVASGQAFDAFVEARILGPLGMDDTAFRVPAEKRGRFMANYAKVGGRLVVADSPVDGQYTRPPAFPSGGGGLTSTASDYIRFAQMLLEGGSLGGVRILAPETVAKMRTNHLPDALVPIDLGTYISPGYGFGLGFAVMVDPDASPEPDNTASFAGPAPPTRSSGSTPRPSSSAWCGPSSPRSPPTTSSASSRRSSTGPSSSRGRAGTVIDMEPPTARGRSAPGDVQHGQRKKEIES